MMDLIRGYIFNVLTASMICAIVVRIAGDRAPVLRSIASVFLAFCIIRPLTGADLSGMIRSFQGSLYQQIGGSMEWSTLGEQALYDGIQERTEAYILTEAKDLGAKIDVEVLLSKDDIPIPEAVTIQGVVSPYQKSRLTHVMTTDLGISKEAVIWK